MCYTCHTCSYRIVSVTRNPEEYIDYIRTWRLEDEAALPTLNNLGECGVVLTPVPSRPVKNFVSGTISVLYPRRSAMAAALLLLRGCSPLCAGYEVSWVSLLL